MPYRYSRARKQFIADVGVVLTTLKDAFSPACTSTSVQNYALCSAVILTSAGFESYLETLVSDWCRALLANGINTDLLPLNTRAFLLNDPAIEGAYKKFILRQNESDFLPEIGGLVGNDIFLFAKNGEVIPAFQPRRLYSDCKYPSPNNIKRLFRRCGIDSVFAKLAAVAQKNVENLLTSFNDVRTEMAHDGMPVGLSATDVRARISDAKSVIGYIDRVFYAHVRKQTGEASWTV
ncbi:HEPN domain-containing protein [Occallatibacter savannae]|uniref:HEPN domain-containing protein n=1 Tax=Occallatibacter savannae TaxID=1002691 RepID=UPI000D6982A7|nr:HEPN domain-containing protein [Occallatibacter savannae]